MASDAGEIERVISTPATGVNRAMIGHSEDCITNSNSSNSGSTEIITVEVSEEQEPVYTGPNYDAGIISSENERRLDEYEAVCMLVGCRGYAKAFAEQDYDSYYYQTFNDQLYYHFCDLHGVPVLDQAEYSLSPEDLAKLMPVFTLDPSSFEDFNECVHKIVEESGESISANPEVKLELQYDENDITPSVIRRTDSKKRNSATMSETDTVVEVPRPSRVKSNKRPRLMNQNKKRRRPTGRLERKVRQREREEQQRAQQRSLKKKSKKSKKVTKKE